jgi:hypothetical protein
VLGESSAPQTVTGTATDAAGNTSGTSVSGLLVDLSDPVITCDSASATFLLGEGGASVSATVSDAVSGPASERVEQAVAADQVGTFSAALVGVDNAGREGSADCAYAVLYDWGGFLAPVAEPPAVNAASAGAAIPLRFSLGGDQGLAVIATGYPRSRQITCSGEPSGEPQEAVPARTSGLTYDATLKTPVATGTPRARSSSQNRS